MRVVVITGGMQGIGAAVASAFEAEGDRVAILDVAEGAPYRYDVADRSAVEEAFVAIEHDLGPVEVPVNNAGVAFLGPSETFGEEKWRRTLDVNVTGAFFASQAAGRRMLELGRGVVVNIASINATEAFPERLAYCASKAALRIMTEVLAVEWAGRGVRVNAVSPGVTRTEMVAEAIQSGIVSEELYLRRTPLGRLGRPEDVAAAVVFLASEESSFITGTTLVVDGGWSAFGYAS